MHDKGQGVMGSGSVAHTPGPWTTHEWGDAAIQIIGPSDEEIADLDGDPEGWEARAANARLIAAAPELLAALKDAARWINLLPAEIRDGSIMPEKLAEVIARVEGR